MSLAVASAVWVCSGKFVATNEKYYHSEVALCIQKEGDCSNNLNYLYDKTVWALDSTTVFFISWGPLYPSFHLCVLLCETWKMFCLLN
jgi:hypothetical protein